MGVSRLGIDEDSVGMDRSEDEVGRVSVMRMMMAVLVVVEAVMRSSSMKSKVRGR